MEQQTFDLLLLTMSALAVVVFAALYYVRAGYGMFQTSKWGISLNNKLGWILMEAPVFFVMLYLWWNSSVRCSAVPLVFFLLFELHYFQRAFIFPFLMKGKSRMPIAIMLMGVVFNVLCRASGFSILLPKDFIRMHGLILLLFGQDWFCFWQVWELIFIRTV